MDEDVVAVEGTISKGQRLAAIARFSTPYARQDQGIATSNLWNSRELSSATSPKIGPAGYRVLCNAVLRGCQTPEGLEQIVHTALLTSGN